MISVGSVLIIDDDSATLELAQEILRNAGYATATASNAFHGLRLVREVKPSVVVCDMVMPNMAGADLFRTIAADPGTSRTGRVMMSGQAGADRSCAHVFLAKPFAAKDLLEAVQKVTSRATQSTSLPENTEPRWRG